MENNWIEVTGTTPVLNFCAPIDIIWNDGDAWQSGSWCVEHFDFTDDRFQQVCYITHWRLHKPEQSLDDAFGLPVGVTPFVYPQTSFKPTSEAQLRSDEAARVNSLLSEKLSTISDIASKLTRKNFSVADIKLVKDLLESVEEYEENR